LSPVTGPISIHIPHVEIPAIEIHTGSVAAIAEPNNNVVLPPRQYSTKKYHPHRNRAGVLVSN
jgi:hypothetical protein